ncbi:F-box/kelch-repeat protein At3g06240-like [Quercus suber]|uniref:F-box/kelch-repeat protein At3g06240-like n=1 Tax=Quercus suber TaxID=58331 RepID=UPI0032DE8F8E
MSLCHVDNDHDHGYVMHMPRSCVGTTQVYTVSCDRTSDWISEFRAPFIHYTYVVGSCNGLLCLYDYWKYNYNVHFWNPSIRKFKSLPTASIILSNTLSLGFAYDSQNDYKLVKVEWPICPSPTLLPVPPPEFEVYSLSSDSWRKVEFGISWRPNIWYYSINYNSPFPFAGGHLHFMVGTIRETGQQEMHTREMILSFDVNSEKIEDLLVPDDDSFKEGSSYGKHLTLFKGKLALIKDHSFQPCGYGHSIWVMMDYGVCKSWNKLFSVTIERPNVDGYVRFNGFTKYGSLLIQQNLGLIYNGKFKIENKFILFDPKTLHHKDISIQFKYPSNLVSLYVATYLESLALHDVENVVSY